MLPLGKEMIRRGHRVTVFGILDMEKRVRAAGLEFKALGLQTFPLGTSLQNLEKLARLEGLAAVQYTVLQLRAWAEVMLYEAPQAFQDCGVDALIANQGSVESGTVADAAGVPYITICSAVPLNQEPRIPPVFTNWSYNPKWTGIVRNQLAYGLQRILSRPLVNLVVRFRKERGLKPYRKPNDVFSPLLQISQFPQEYEFPRMKLPANFYFTGPFHSQESREAVPFPWEKLRGKPLIYASMGTLQNKLENTFRAIIEACENLDVDLVLSLGQKTDNFNLKSSPNVTVVPYAPQLELLKKATMMITHAGANSTMECLMNAVPMVAIPVSNDQPGNSARIRWNQVGEVVALGQLSAPLLKKKIELVLNHPKYKKNAVRLQKAILTSGGVQRAANLIEKAIQSKKSVFGRAFAVNSLSFSHQESKKILDQFFHGLQDEKSEVFSEALVPIQNFAISAQKNSDWAITAEKCFREFVVPHISQNFPDLLTEKMHSPLLKKIQMVASRVFVFHLIAGKMRKAPVEPELNCLFSALYVIYDTLFDDPVYFDIENPASFSRIQEALRGQETTETIWPLEKLFRGITKRVFELVSFENQASFTDIFQKLNEVQYESAFFKTKDVNVEILLANTFLKGGYATQLSVLLSPKSLSKIELDYFLLLGAPIQLADDFGDLLEDRVAGLETLATLKAIEPLKVWAMYKSIFKSLSLMAKSKDYDTEYFQMFEGMVAFYISKNLDIYTKSQRG